MMTRRWPYLYVALVAQMTVWMQVCGPLTPAFSASPEGLQQQVDETARGILSSDCRTRMRASNDFLRYARTEDVAGITHILDRDYPRVGRYLGDAMQFVRELAAAREVTEAAMKTALETSLRDVGEFEMRPVEFVSRYAAALMERIRAEHPVNQFHLVLILVESSRHPQPAVASVFVEAVQNLLKDQNPAIRTVAAVAVFDFKEHAEHLPGFDELMRRMLDGLLSPDGSVRYMASLKVLPNLHPDICYNPLDPSDVRQEAVRALRTRWEQVFAVLNPHAGLVQ
jgi:hypothetical protein